MRGLLPGLSLICLLLTSCPLLGSANASAAPRYRVTLTTLSPGQEVFERFGHTVLSIEDSGDGESAGHGAWVYSFGTFDGDAPHLWHKALHKRLRYWVISMSPLLMSLRYDHREGLVQELALDDQQAALLLTRLSFLVRPENREYPYDLFTDNCVTRIRDLLNEACAGALLRHTAGPAPRTAREEVARTLAPVPLLGAVATLIYGPYTDAPRSRWDTLFLPGSLRTALAEIEIGEGSARHALVRGERRWRGARFAPPSDLPHPLWGPFVLGLLLGVGIVCLLRGRTQRGRAVLGSVGFILSLLLGIVGLALRYLQTTPHPCFQNNQNSALFSPLSLLVAPLFVLLLRDPLGHRGRRFLLVAVSLLALVPSVHLLLRHLPNVTHRCPQAHEAVWITSAALHATLVGVALLLTFQRPRTIEEA